MTKNEILDLINLKATAVGIPPLLAKAVVHAESNFNPTAVSPVGAQGLMQLMPATAKSLGVTNAFDPVQNITAGTKMLSNLYKEFKGDWQKALGAYNWGSGNITKHPDFASWPTETRNYVTKIMKEWQLIGPFLGPR